jgi:predicted nucleic acid-binding protein
MLNHKKNEIVDKHVVQALETDYIFNSNVRNETCLQKLGRKYSSKEAARRTEKDVAW